MTKPWSSTHKNSASTCCKTLRFPTKNAGFSSLPQIPAAPPFCSPKPTLPNNPAPSAIKPAAAYFSSSTPTTSTATTRPTSPTASISSSPRARNPTAPSPSSKISTATSGISSNPPLQSIAPPTAIDSPYPSTKNLYCSSVNGTTDNLPILTNGESLKIFSFLISSSETAFASAFPALIFTTDFSGSFASTHTSVAAPTALLASPSS